MTTSDDLEMSGGVKTLFTSCACNRTPNSVHWAFTGLIAYGATNGIAVVSVW